MKILSITTVLFFNTILYAQVIEGFSEDFEPLIGTTSCSATCVLDDGRRIDINSTSEGESNPFSGESACRDQLLSQCTELGSQTADNSTASNDTENVTSVGCNAGGGPIVYPKLKKDYLSIAIAAHKRILVNQSSSGFTVTNTNGSCRASWIPEANSGVENIAKFSNMRVRYNFPAGLTCSTREGILRVASKLCYIEAHMKAEKELDKIKPQVDEVNVEDVSNEMYMEPIDYSIVTDTYNPNLSEELALEKVNASDPLGYCKIGESKHIFYGESDDTFNPVLEKYCYCKMGFNEEGATEFSTSGFELVNAEDGKYKQCVNMACYVMNNGNDPKVYKGYSSDVQGDNFNMSPSGSGVTFNEPFCSDRDMNQWFRDYRKLQKDREKGLAEKVEEICSIAASSGRDKRQCRKELAEITQVLFKENTVDKCEADVRNNDKHRAEHSCADLNAYEIILTAAISTPFDSICRGKLGEEATTDQINSCGLKYTQGLTNSYFQTELAKCESPALQSADSVKTCQNLVLENIISHSSDEDVVKMAACVDNNPGNMGEIKLCVGDIIVNSIANDTLLEQLKEQYCTAKRDDEGNIYKYLTAAEQRECLHTLLIHNTADLNDELKKCLSIEDETERSKCQRDILIKAIVEDRRFDVEACWEYPLTVSNPYRNERAAKRANPFDRSRMDRNMCVDLSKHVSYEAQICEAKTSITDKINCFGSIKPQELAKTYLSRKIGRLFKHCEDTEIPTDTQNLCAKKTAFEQCKNAPEERQMNCMLNMMDETIVAKVEDINRHCLEEANPDQCFQAAQTLNQNGLVPDPTTIAAFNDALSSDPTAPSVTVNGVEVDNPNDDDIIVDNEDGDDAVVVDNTDGDTDVVVESSSDGDSNVGADGTALVTTGVGVGTVMMNSGGGSNSNDEININRFSPNSLGGGNNAGSAGAWDTVNNANRYDDSGATGLFKDTKYMSMKDTNPNSQACSKLKKAAIIRFGGLLTSVGVGVTAGAMAIKAMKKDDDGQRNSMKAMVTLAAGATAAVGVKLLANLWAKRVVEGAITDETLRRQQDPSSMMISTCTTRSERKKATSFYFDQEEFKIHDYKKLEKSSMIALNQISDAKNIAEINSIFKEWDDYYHGHRASSLNEYDDFFTQYDLNDEIGLEEIKFIVMNSIENTVDAIIPSAYAEDESNSVGPKTQAEIMSELTGQIDPKVLNAEQMDSLVLLIDYGEVIGVDTTAYTKRGVDLKKREVAVENLARQTTGEEIEEESE
jgi:hypothetical protein